MSASDNLSKKLFHGTAATLKVGDVIEPRGDVAWAAKTPGPAQHAAKRDLSGIPHYLMFGKEGTNPVESYQLPMFNPVYTVEPIDEKEAEKTSEERGASSDVLVSNKGFKVTGLHSWESKPL